MNNSLVIPSPPQYSVLKDRSNSTIEKETFKESTAPRVSKPRSRSSVSTVANRHKIQQSLIAHSLPKPLNTHSPVAVAAANAVTADKIYDFLKAQGPLPIRNITSHLANNIHGFGELSLSKQRRLIIAVLEGPRSQFKKVGWGRWAVITGEQPNPQNGTTPTQPNVTTTAPNVTTGTPAATSTSPKVRINSPRQHSKYKHHRSFTLTGDTTKRSIRARQSITANLPGSKPPISPPLAPLNDSAILSESESDSEIENTDEEDWQSLGPSNLRETSPREKEAIAALVQLHSKH